MFEVPTSINRTKENKVARFKVLFKNVPREKRCVTHHFATRRLGMARHQLVMLVVKDTVLKRKGTTTNVRDLPMAVAVSKNKDDE